MKMSVCVTMRPVCILPLPPPSSSSNVMPNTHSPPRKPLNYVLDDLPPSPAACPILGQRLFRGGERQGQEREIKRKE